MNEYLISSLESQLEKDPNSRVFLRLAEELRRAGQLDRAIEVCQTGLKKHPNYLPALVCLGRSQHASGRLPEAEELFDDVLKMAPDNVHALRGLGDIACDTGDPETGLRYYETLEMLDASEEISEKIADIRQRLSRRDEPTEREDLESDARSQPPPPEPEPKATDQPNDTEQASVLDDEEDLLVPDLDAADTDAADADNDPFLPLTFDQPPPEEPRLEQANQGHDAPPPFEEFDVAEPTDASAPLEDLAASAGTEDDESSILDIDDPAAEIIAPAEPQPPERATDDALQTPPDRTSDSPPELQETSIPTEVSNAELPAKDETVAQRKIRMLNTWLTRIKDQNHVPRED